MSPLAVLALVLLPLDPSDPAQPVAAGAPPGRSAERVLTSLGLARRAPTWALEHDEAASPYGAYRKNYFLPLSFNSQLNRLPPAAAGSRNREVEARFQVSIRYDFLERGRTKLVGAYTARSHWQVYDLNGSAPFRTTDHEPEVFLERARSDRLLWRLGVNHQSNGESGPRSRSWNRVFAQALWFSEEAWTEPESWRVSLRWWREGFLDETNNPDIEKFLGRFELSGDYFFDAPLAPQLALLVRDNLRFEGRHAAGAQLDFSFGLPGLEGVRVLFQYFGGYGDSLLDFRSKVDRFSLGIEVSP